MENKDTKPTIGIGILSWRAHDTLRLALESYAQNGFLSLFDEKLIYFSDMSDEDIALANEFGWSYAGGANEGIAGGMKRLGEKLSTDYVILLQNDNPIVEAADFAKSHICAAVELLEAKKADLVRLRHRWQVGDGFPDVGKYLKMHGASKPAVDFIPEAQENLPTSFDDSAGKMLRRLMRPDKAKRMIGRGVFIEDDLAAKFPNYVQKQGEFFILSSFVMEFSDQCLMMSRDFWLNTLMVYVDANPASTRSSNGFQAPELCINGAWWRNKHYKVAQGRGIFTHRRVDGSFRPEHHTNQSDEA